MLLVVTIACIAKESVDLSLSFVKIMKNLKKSQNLCVADLCIKTLGKIPKKEITDSKTKKNWF